MASKQDLSVVAPDTEFANYVKRNGLSAAAAAYAKTEAEAYKAFSDVYSAKSHVRMPDKRTLWEKVAGAAKSAASTAASAYKTVDKTVDETLDAVDRTVGGEAMINAARKVSAAAASAKKAAVSGATQFYHAAKDVVVSVVADVEDATANLGDRVQNAYNSYNSASERLVAVTPEGAVYMTAAGQPQQPHGDPSHKPSGTSKVPPTPASQHTSTPEHKAVPRVAPAPPAPTDLDKKIADDLENGPLGALTAAEPQVQHVIPKPEGATLPDGLKMPESEWKLLPAEAKAAAMQSPAAVEALNATYLRDKTQRDANAHEVKTAREAQQAVEKREAEIRAQYEVTQHELKESKDKVANISYLKSQMEDQLKEARKSGPQLKWYQQGAAVAAMLIGSALGSGIVGGIIGGSIAASGKDKAVAEARQDERDNAKRNYAPKLENLTTTVDEKTKEADTLRTMVADYRGKADDAQVAAKEAQEQAKKVASDLEALKTDTLKIKNDYAAADKAKADALKAKADAEKAAASAAAEAKKLAAQNRTLEDEVKATSNNLTIAARKSDEMDALRNQYTKLTEQFNTEIKKAQADAARDYNAKLSAAEQAKADAEKRAAETARQYESKVQQAESKVKALETEVATIKAQPVKVVEVKAESAKTVEAPKAEQKTVEAPKYEQTTVAAKGPMIDAFKEGMNTDNVLVPPAYNSLTKKVKPIKEYKAVEVTTGKTVTVPAMHYQTFKEAIAEGLGANIKFPTGRELDHMLKEMAKRMPKDNAEAKNMADTAIASGLATQSYKTKDGTVVDSSAAHVTQNVVQYAKETKQTVGDIIDGGMKESQKAQEKADKAAREAAERQQEAQKEAQKKADKAARDAAERQKDEQKKLAETQRKQVEKVAEEQKKAAELQKEAQKKADKAARDAAERQKDEQKKLAETQRKQAEKQAEQARKADEERKDAERKAQKLAQEKQEQAEREAKKAKTAQVAPSVAQPQHANELHEVVGPAVPRASDRYVPTYTDFEARKHETGDTGEQVHEYFMQRMLSQMEQATGKQIRGTPAELEARTNYKAGVRDHMTSVIFGGAERSFQNANVYVSAKAKAFMEKNMAPLQELVESIANRGNSADIRSENKTVRKFDSNKSRVYMNEYKNTSALSDLLNMSVPDFAKKYEKDAHAVSYARTFGAQVYASQAEIAFGKLGAEAKKGAVSEDTLWNLLFNAKLAADVGRDKQVDKYMGKLMEDGLRLAGNKDSKLGDKVKQAVQKRIVSEFGTMLKGELSMDIRKAVWQLMAEIFPGVIHENARYRYAADMHNKAPIEQTAYGQQDVASLATILNMTEKFMPLSYDKQRELGRLYATTLALNADKTIRSGDNVSMLDAFEAGINLEKAELVYFVLDDSRGESWKAIEAIRDAWNGGLQSKYNFDKRLMLEIAKLELQYDLANGKALVQGVTDAPLYDVLDQLRKAAQWGLFGAAKAGMFNKGGHGGHGIHGGQGGGGGIDGGGGGGLGGGQGGGGAIGN